MSILTGFVIVLSYVAVYRFVCPPAPTEKTLGERLMELRMTNFNRWKHKK